MSMQTSVGEENLPKLGKAKQILIIEDEPTIADYLTIYCRAEGYEVSYERDGLDGLARFQAEQPDFVLLDLMLPGLDGVEVCRRIRSTSDVPIIMVTARSEEVDKLLGLEIGADDYVTKPFSPRELMARIKALLRRPRQAMAVSQTGSASSDNTPAPQHWNDLTIDETQHEVTLRGQPVELTAREFALLLELSRHPGRVFTRPQLLERVWGDAYYDEHVVDVHIGNLRKKLEADLAHPRYLETVRGVGYRFRRRRE